MSRWLPLYLRSRRVPLAVTVSAAAVTVVGVTWRAFAGRPEVHTSLAVLTAVLVLAPLISTMSGDDDELESTAALRWPPRRALHLAGIALVTFVLIAGAGPAGVDLGSAGQILRNSAGLAGLAGIGVALAGVQFAWLAPVVWAGVQAMGSPGHEMWSQMVFWLLQPAASRPSALLAGALAVTGLIAYAARIGRVTG
ncbi:hypothetical protein [Actinoplanes sp. G11-F43]|uniref:hypothetical protein n=1 Tax=Actinoplanes sp. G11-F43 TaxID=3424130 RepID=UPI003D340E78